jgi:ribosomal protein S18 acetylase RimI-like enzyme
MQIIKVDQITDELVSAFERLIPQLSASARIPGKAELTEILNSPGAILFIARDPDQQDQIVGTLTLVIYRIPTGLSGHIEDVVVDASARGKGVGEALCHAAIEAAKTAGAKMVDLTSNPAREAANRLYLRMGFEKRETNVYRYKL